MADASLTFSDLALILRRRKARITVVFVAVFALTVAGLVYWPRSYDSEAKLLVRLGRESVTLDATATFGPTMGVQQDRQNEINSVLAVLQSRAVSEGVVDRIGVDEVLKGGAGMKRASPDLVGELKSQIKSALQMPEISRREEAVRAIEKSVHFNSPKLSNVIAISARSQSPEFAQQIVSACCDVFLDEHVRLHHTTASFTFFTDQTQELLRELKGTEEELRDAKNTFGMASIGGRRAMLENQIDAVESASLTREVEVAASRSRIAALQAQRDAIPANIVTQSTSGFANAAADGMRQQLYDLEIRERKLRQNLTENHPELIAVKIQLAEVRQIMQEQAADRTQTTTAVNAEHQKISLDLADEEARFASLDTAQKSLREQLAKLRGAVHQLNSQEILIAQLQRKIDVLAANYRTHTERLEQARVDDALAADKISNVRVFQSATLQESPTSPRVGATLLLGFVAAVFGGLGSAMIGLRPAPVPARASRSHRRADVTAPAPAPTGI